MRILGAMALACGLLVGSLQAWDMQIKAKEVKVVLKSDQKPVSGNNHFSLTPTLAGKPLKGAQVKLKFSMPEMPGMPAMHENAQVKEKDGLYDVKVNLPMGGTWQVKLELKTKEGKTYKGKGSLDL
ncbi:FixH family protein [Helicobacter cynogastricus]|uniref:OMP1014 n=1 Tax=Helicobacter cynogastricus TaxID=329937 RepID=A0A1R3UDJ2_9HELI|nr:FixH family protein [Helicobacter cynogastricus]SFZ72139.1 OMP1014 [Helicobacter cynogastricus]